MLQFITNWRELMHQYSKPIAILLLASSTWLAQPVGATNSGASITRQPSPEFLAGRELPRKRHGSANVMAMYEIAMISRLCSARAQTPLRTKSKRHCARALFEIRQKCTQKFQHKFPRADDRRLDGRLDHRSFASSYRGCLLKRLKRRQTAAGRKE